MKLTAIPLLLASIAAAVPAPASKPVIPEEWKRSMEYNLDMIRRTTQLSDNDILNFALTLEHLEETFYKQGLKMFSPDDFKAAGFRPVTRFSIKEVKSDEHTHVATLESVLGNAAVPRCKYDFGLTDPKSFVRTAALLEGVGVTAYLGAAALIADPDYLTVAAAILTVEARHSSYLRLSQPIAQSPFPSAFDVPLSAMEVYTLASAFIKKCPKKANLGITPFPTLTLDAGQVPIAQGDEITLTLEDGTTVNTDDNYAAFLSALGPVFTDFSTSMGGSQVTVKVPPGIAGQSYVVLTKSANSVSDDNVVAGPGVVPIQPPYLVQSSPMH